MASESLPPTEPGPPSGGAGTGRLDSWKDIAAYLNRDVSTVQRWEKREGMPVHRHVHDKLGTVYAFRSELDAWWRGRRLALEESAPAPAAAPTQTSSLPPTALDSAEGNTRLSPPLWYHPRRWRLVATAGLAALVAVFALRSGQDADIRSLAVLPFDAHANDPVQDHLAHGIADAVARELGRVEGLRVIAGGAVLRYNGQSDPRRAARDLGVQAVVTGRVQRTANRVSVTATVVASDTGDTMWTGRFDRDVQEIQRLQRDVTRAIAERVRARLPAVLQTTATLHPVNPDAYDAVLRARYLSVRTTDEDNRAAIALARKAIGLDAGFAPAYAELASALVTRLAYVTPDETLDLEQEAFAAAEKALAIDPDLPEAYLARGDLLWSASQRFAHERAVTEFRRALERQPNSDEAHRRLARVFVHLGFFDEAIQHASIALAINPSNAQALNSKAQALLWRGQNEEALAILQDIPGPVLPELVEANTVFALLHLGRRDEAAAQLARALERHPSDQSGSLPAMQALLLAESDPGASAALIRQVTNRKAVNPSHHAAYFAASAFARMGRAADAAHWLREAADTGFPCYTLFALDPALDPVRQDPRFAAALHDLQKRSEALRRLIFPTDR